VLEQLVLEQPVLERLVPAPRSGWARPGRRRLQQAARP
jgi:hypothetical protein